MSTVSPELRRLVERPISGFPEFGPDTAIAMARVVDTIRAHYERAGYSPLVSPLVERVPILSAKADGEIKHQVYGMTLLNPPEKKAAGNNGSIQASPGHEKDDDAEDNLVGFGLRFDHTVQLARYVAAKYGGDQIRFPFRRYAIGPVFRGEQPKDGRSRQFTQADIDAIGDGTISFLHDSEMVRIVSDIFEELAIGPFTMRFNNRKVLEGILRSFNCDTDAKVNAARRIIDKVDDGFDKTVMLLAGMGVESGRQLLELYKAKRSSADWLNELTTKNYDSGFKEGVAELELVYDGIRKFRVPEERVELDPMLARGLDYYTSTVFEARLDAHPDLSIAGGGRYDNLAEQFVDHHLPGVGISIGVTRLVSRLINKGLLQADSSTIAPVLITTLDLKTHAEEYFAMARELRDAGVAAEIYLNEAKLGKQLDHANHRGFAVAVIAGSNEFSHTENGEPDPLVTVRDMNKGDQLKVPRRDLVATVKAML